MFIAVQSAIGKLAFAGKQKCRMKNKGIIYVGSYCSLENLLTVGFILINSTTAMLCPN